MPETQFEAGDAIWRALPTTSTQEVVVTTDHERIVAQKIRELRAFTPTATKRSAELDLVLLDVGALPEIGPRGGDGLRELLEDLYTVFRNDYHWVPTLGRNRHVAVVPTNKTIPGGDGAPAVAEASDVVFPTGSAGTGVRVAVGDTGLAQRPQFWGHVIAEPDPRLAEGDLPPEAVLGHGTFVTGLVLQQAPQATVRALKVLNAPEVTDTWDVATGLVGLAGESVDILNLSLGCHTDDDQAPLVFRRLLERLGPDVLVVAAAGNFGEGEPRKALWPAALEDVVAVGATDDKGNRPDWSPDPERSPWVDVQARGQEVASTYLDGEVVTEYTSDLRPELRKFRGYGTWSGTSFAAARVTGMIAAVTQPGQRSAREAFEQLTSKACLHDTRPWLG
jgi:membrane-anchored mycosin MYCP